MESREYDDDRDGKSGRRNHHSGHHRAASTSPWRHRRERGESSVDVVFAVAAVAATSPRKVRASNIGIVHLPFEAIERAINVVGHFD